MKKNLLVITLISLLALSSCGNSNSDTQSDTSANVQTETPAEAQPFVPPVVPADATESQLEALATAESFIASSPFSKEGLASFLVNPTGYSEADAEFAAEYCSANWSEQAVLSAESYLEGFPKTTSGELIEQLKFEGYTDEEIEFAINTLGI